MKIFVIGDIEKLKTESDLQILVPASMQEIMLEERVLKRDFLMDTVAGLRMQNPDMSSREIADKMLLEEELIENILKREKEIGDVTRTEPIYRKCHIICNQLTDNVYGKYVSDSEISEIGECSTDVRVASWSCRGFSDTAHVIPWKFLKNCISDGYRLKGDALRAIAGVQEIEDSGETVVCNPSVFSPEVNCYILTGIKWNSTEKFLSFDNWSVFGLTGEDKTDTGLHLKIVEHLNTPEYQSLRGNMERVFERVVRRKALTAVVTDQRLNSICSERGIEISDLLKSRIIERQRALIERSEDNRVTVAMKLFSTMEWELFEVLNSLGKRRRKKLPDIYSEAIDKPQFVYELFKKAELKYEEKFFNTYFSYVNAKNIGQILVKQDSEPTFGVLLVSMLLNHDYELKDKAEQSSTGGYAPVLRLKEKFPDFMIAFDLANFKKIRNAEKHQSIVTSENLGAMINLCGKLDAVFFGIDFIAELGTVSDRTRKRVKVNDDLINSIGLENEGDITILQNLLSNYVSEDSHMYNDCEQLLISVMDGYLSKCSYRQKYGDREQRNGMIATALRSVGIDAGDGKFGFMKSTLSPVLVPQKFCDLIVCDGQNADKPFLKALQQNEWLPPFIDDLVGNKIGHTNALFEAREAGRVLEYVEEFIRIITKL